MDNNNIIISVGRQLGCGGHVIAAILAEAFGCKLYDKEILNLAAKESGFCESFFKENDEQKGFFKSTVYTHMPFLSSSSFYNNKLSQESLFQFQSDAIRKAAEERSCVFVGRCADYVLRDNPRMVSIFISADIDERAARIADERGCDKETAVRIITTRENERANYYNYYTGKKWGHSASYDLCINSSRLGMEDTAEIIKMFIKKKLG
ncbi:MAG: AAA family ATPase [Prevotella sp.]